MAQAPTYASVSNQIQALKELYSDDSWVMKDLVFKKNPFYALVPKDESPEGFAGKYIPVPLVYGAPQGRSHTFTNAQTNQTAPALGSFFVYRVSDYQLVTITNELLEATKGNAGAFVDEAKLNMDTGFRNFANNTSFELFASGTGSRGTISTGGVSYSAPNISFTLADPNTSVFFEVGMTLVAAATDGGTPTTTSGTQDAAQIVSINMVTGAITALVTAGAPQTNWAAAYFLVNQGDSPVASNTAGTNNGYLAVTGLSGWCPTSVASNDNFWGVNRSSNPSRLAGLYLNASNESIEEGLIDAAVLVSKFGGEPDYGFVNFTTYGALLKALGSKVQYVQVKHDEADIAFAGITLHAPYGPITIIPDRSCPANTGFLLQMDSWKLRSLGKVPHILTYGLEGLEGIRVGNADALEVRIGGYYNLISNAPGWNCRVTLSD